MSSASQEELRRLEKQLGSDQLSPSEKLDIRRRIKALHLDIRRADDGLRDSLEAARAAPSKILALQKQLQSSHLSASQKADIRRRLAALRAIHAKLDGEDKLRQSLEAARAEVSGLKRKVARLRAAHRPNRPERRRSGSDSDDSVSADSLRAALAKAREADRRLRAAETEDASHRTRITRLLAEGEQLQRTVTRLQQEKEALKKNMCEAEREREKSRGDAGLNEIAKMMAMWKQRCLTTGGGGLLVRDSEAERRIMELQGVLAGLRGEAGNVRAAKDALEQQLDAEGRVSQQRSRTLSGLQDRLQQHFEKSQAELREFKKREQDHKDNNRALENKLSAATLENTRLKERLKSLQGRRGATRRRRSPTTMDTSSDDGFSSDEMSISPTRRSPVMDRQLLDKMRSMRQQLHEMEYDRRTVLDEILTPAASRAASLYGSTQRKYSIVDSDYQ